MPYRRTIQLPSRDRVWWVLPKCRLNNCSTGIPSGVYKNQDAPGCYKGILLLYNGKNSDGDNSDPNLPKGTYSVGQVLIDAANPEKVLERSDSYILKPTLPHEQTGQYKSGTVFGEGLVYFKKKWFLYYGTADSYIGVAVSDQKL